MMQQLDSDEFLAERSALTLSDSSDPLRLRGEHARIEDGGSGTIG